jgi:hypothetical protein
MRSTGKVSIADQHGERKTSSMPVEFFYVWFGSLLTWARDTYIRSAKIWEIRAELTPLRA